MTILNLGTQESGNPEIWDPKNPTFLGLQIPRFPGFQISKPSLGPLLLGMGQIRAGKVASMHPQQGLNGWSRIQRVVNDSTDGQGLNGWPRAQQVANPFSGN